jgi:hypothetical protein
VLRRHLLAKVFSLTTALTVIDVCLPDLFALLPLPRVGATIGTALGFFDLPDSNHRPVFSRPFRTFITT